MGTVLTYSTPTSCYAQSSQAIYRYMGGNVEHTISSLMSRLSIGLIDRQYAVVLHAL